MSFRIFHSLLWSTQSKALGIVNTAEIDVFLELSCFFHDPADADNLISGYSAIGRNDTKAETPILWPPHEKSWLIGKDSDVGRDWGQEQKGTTEDEMAGWHHGLDGHEPEWTPGVGDGQGGLACCDSWGRKEADTTERLNWTELTSWTFVGKVISLLFNILSRFVSLSRYIPKYFILFVSMVNGIVSLFSRSIDSFLVYRNARDFCVYFISCNFTIFID